MSHYAIFLQDYVNYRWKELDYLQEEFRKEQVIEEARTLWNAFSEKEKQEVIEGIYATK